MDKYNVYQDMSRRTGGEIYLGIVGPGAYRQIDFYQTFYGACCDSGNGG